MQRRFLCGKGNEGMRHRQRIRANVSRPGGGEEALLKAACCSLRSRLLRQFVGGTGMRYCWCSRGRHERGCQSEYIWPNMRPADAPDINRLNKYIEKGNYCIRLLRYADVYCNHKEGKDVFRFPADGNVFFKGTAFCELNSTEEAVSFFAYSSIGMA